MGAEAQRFLRIAAHGEITAETFKETASSALFPISTSSFNIPVMKR